MVTLNTGLPDLARWIIKTASENPLGRLWLCRELPHVRAAQACLDFVEPRTPYFLLDDGLDDLALFFWYIFTARRHHRSGGYARLLFVLPVTNGA